MRISDETKSGVALAAAAGTLCLGIYLAARSHSRWTDPMRSPDWALKIKVLDKFEKPGSAKWAGDWDQFAD